MSYKSNGYKEKEEIEHIVTYTDKSGNIKKIEKYNLKNFQDKTDNKDVHKELYKMNFIYIGEWKNNMREGKGIYYNPFTKEKYEGEFKNGKADGKGTLYYNNGDIFKGQFKNWLKEGFGIYYYHNGDRYEGTFKNDNPEKGKYIYKEKK